ncbi:MAG: hypothetical protein IKJ42_01020 [Bacteroidaceae bacterium]|nr:hypothetical protein [Bacteroidaceae bacterium]
MNKKFISAILFGALTVASTSTFVSCKDYDDDIDQLQMQIDQNASSAASDLAAKVAALESQISTLNSAKQDLASQLAAAKTEAANAAAAALDAAKGAQSGADAANKALAEAAAKVAVLETKVASLESVVADLQTAKANLNAQVSDLQSQMAAVKADTKANADAIAKANAEILAKYTELSGKITEVSATLGARIDVIDAALNTIKGNYVTKDELNAKVTELAAVDAQLNAQIATNLKYIETLQATVKELAAKDAELAAKIEADYADLLGKINTVAAEQATALKDIQTWRDSVAANAEEIVAIKEALAGNADQSALDELMVSLGNTQADVMNITESLAQLKGEIADQKSELEDKIAAAEKNAKDYAYDLILKLTDIVNANTGNIATNTDAIDALQAAVADLSDMANGRLADFITSAEQESALADLYDGISAELDNYVSIVDLKRLYADREEIDAQLATLNEELNTWKAGFEEEYAAMKEELKGDIDALKNLNADLVTLKNAVEVLQERVNAIINSVQSVVFVPQYKNNNWDVPTSFLPQYAYNETSTAWEATTSLYFTSTIKFRVQPTGVAQKLADAWIENKDLINLESADALISISRAAQQYMSVEDVKAEGDYLLVKAKNTCETGEDIPTTLVITNEVNDSTVLAKTSDYFKVRNLSINRISYIGLFADTEGLNGHVRYISGNFAVVNYIAGVGNVTIHNTYFDEYPYTKFSTKNTADNSYDLPEANIVLDGTPYSDSYFEVTENGVKVLPAADGTANPDAVGKSITVALADAAYGRNANGDYNVRYNVTYTIAKDVCELTYTIPAFNIKWNTTTANAQRITVETIAAEADQLAAYKQTAQGVFDMLFNAVGTSCIISGTNGCSAALVAETDATTQEKYITVTPIIDINTANYVGTKNALTQTFTLGQNQEIELTINGEINLSIPEAKEFFIKREQYWDGTNDVNVRVNYNVADLDKNVPYVYNLAMDEVYSNIDTWTTAGVNHQWTIDAYEVNGVTYNVISGITIAGDQLTVDGPVELSAGGDSIYKTANDMTFTAKATMGQTTLATYSKQGFHVTFPTEGKSLEVTDEERNASEFENSAVFVAEGVNYTDKDTHKWIVNGVFDAEWKTTWGYTNLKYEVISAKIISTGTDITNDFAPEFADPTKGELSIQNAHNLTKDIEIVVKVSFDYNYQVGISNTFKVTVKAE